MFIKKMVGITLSISALFFSSCKKSGEEANTGPSGNPFPITATTGMIADVIRQVGGDNVEVTGLIGEGIDPHLYKPTRKDLVSLNGADMIFSNGLKLEGKMEDVFSKMKKNGKPVIEVTSELAKKEGYLLGDIHHPDPHAWMDVSGWMQATETITTSLSDFDPAHAESYRTNSQAYLKELAGTESNMPSNPSPLSPRANVSSSPPTTPLAIWVVPTDSR